MEFEFNNSTLPSGFYPLQINYIGRNDSIINRLKNEFSNDETLQEVEKKFLLPILARIKDINFNKEKEVRLMYKILEPEVEALNNSSDCDVFFSFKEDNSINLELRVPFSTPKDNSEMKILTLKRIYLGEQFLNSEDNISALLLMNYFGHLCEEKGIELIW